MYIPCKNKQQGNKSIRTLWFYDSQINKLLRDTQIIFSYMFDYILSIITDKGQMLFIHLEI